MLSQGLSKAYRLVHEQVKATSLAEAPSRWLRAPLTKRADGETFWALKDVSLEFTPCEAVGVSAATEPGRHVPHGAPPGGEGGGDLAQGGCLLDVGRPSLRAIRPRETSTGPGQKA